ncbi:MAG: hypothetical protein AB1797_04175 [bacterium]
MRTPGVRNEAKEVLFEDEIELSELLATEKVIPFKWEKSNLVCPICKKNPLEKGSVDMELCDYLAIIHKVTVYHCPACKKTTLSNQARKKIKERIKETEEMAEGISALW